MAGLTFEPNPAAPNPQPFQEQPMFQNKRHFELSLELCASTDIKPNLIFSLEPVIETCRYLWDEWLTRMSFFSKTPVSMLMQTIFRYNY